MMMKNKLYIIVLLAAFSFGCEEIPPVVGMDATPIDPTEEQVKNVLIEEYTGVQCVNCPAGAALIDGMKQQYGSRLVPIAVHAGGFAFPISGASTSIEPTNNEHSTAACEQHCVDCADKSCSETPSSPNNLGRGAEASAWPTLSSQPSAPLVSWLQALNAMLTEYAWH